MSDSIISIAATVGSIFRPLTSPNATNLTEYFEETNVGFKTCLVLTLPLDKNTQFNDITPASRVDRTIVPKQLTNISSVAIDTGAGYPTGRSAAEFSGTNQRLTDSSSDYAFGTGDFTIEFWFNSDNVAGTGVGPRQLGFLQTSDAAGGLKTTYTTGVLIVQGAAGITGLDGGLSANVLNTTFGSSGAVITTNKWYHVALTRASGVCRLFLDGSLINSATVSGSIDGTNLCVGGYYNTSYLYDGHLQDFRIYKGVAKYTAAFSPPARLVGGFSIIPSSSSIYNARLQTVIAETGIATNKFSIPNQIDDRLHINKIEQNPKGFPYTISPALDDGTTGGDFSVPFTITGTGTTGRCYTLTPQNDTTVIVKIWGAGGGEYFYLGRGAGGGGAWAKINLQAGIAYSVFAGGRGTNNSEGTVSVRGTSGGGAASGILLASDQSEILISGGGGGGNGVYGAGRGSGAGGGPSGQDGEGPTSGGDGGTQTAGGAGGNGGRRVGASATDTNGAGGATGTPTYPGGTSGVPGKYAGGIGDFNGGDAGSPGGGGGHFGGGQGGGDTGALGSGGGSGFAKMSSLSIVGLGTTAIYTGVATVPGLGSDSDRGDYGGSGQPGKVMFLGF